MVTLSASLERCVAMATSGVVMKTSASVAPPPSQAEARQAQKTQSSDFVGSGLGKPLIQPQATQLPPLALGAWSSSPVLQAAFMRTLYNT